MSKNPQFIAKSGTVSLPVMFLEHMPQSPMANAHDLVYADNNCKVGSQSKKNSLRKHNFWVWPFPLTILTSRRIFEINHIYRGQEYPSVQVFATNIPALNVLPWPVSWSRHPWLTFYHKNCITKTLIWPPLEQWCTLGPQSIIYPVFIPFRVIYPKTVSPEIIIVVSWT